MNHRITRREIAKQLLLGIEVLLEWIEQRETSNKKTISNNIEGHFLASRLLTAPEVSRILN